MLADSNVLIGTNIALAVAAIASAVAAVVAVRSSNKVAEAGERPVVIEFSAEALQADVHRASASASYHGQLTLTARNVGPGVAALREASVRAKHLPDTMIPATCSAWIVPHDVTFQGVKIGADISTLLLPNGEPGGEIIVSVRYEDVDLNRYESLFTVGLDDRHRWRILAVQVYFCKKDWTHKRLFIDTGPQPT